MSYATSAQQQYGPYQAGTRLGQQQAPRLAQQLADQVAEATQICHRLEGVRGRLHQQGPQGLQTSDAGKPPMFRTLDSQVQDLAQLHAAAQQLLNDIEQVI